jgi:hypothetical protein
LLAFQSLQPSQNFFQKGQPIVDLPIPAVEFTKQEPKDCGPGGNEKVAQINA